MNITFILGNGFDLACGLKTRFKDVYKEYCKEDSKDTDAIKEFKKDIEGYCKNKNGEKNDIKSVEVTSIDWSDFEMALPEYGKKVGDFKKFKEAVIDFTLFLENYLSEQQQQLNVAQYKAEVSELMRKYIFQINEYCSFKSRAILRSKTTDAPSSCHYSFITFNYTNTLEQCLKDIPRSTKKNNQYNNIYSIPRHIHRKLYEGILLGLDNEELYKVIPHEDIQQLRNFVDKIHINGRSSDITNQLVAKIKDSNIIVIFGWSMGDSDSYWVNVVKKAFTDDKQKTLIYAPYYKEDVNKRIPSEIFDREDEVKQNLQKKLGLLERDMSRVHIVTDWGYMKLEFLTTQLESTGTEN